MNFPDSPLSGIRIVHLASLGPGPYGAMLLADMGADVVVVDRVPGLSGSMPASCDPRRRGQRSIAVNLKTPEGRGVLVDLVRTADVLIEGMRPGVAEKLGVGPEDLRPHNGALVYARMTGWGQDGPNAQRAGHDINYIAATGVLDGMGEASGPPLVPSNLLGDYAGGGAFLVISVLAALWQRLKNGRGTVVDMAIVDGVTSLTAAMTGMASAGLWTRRGQNPFDGSRPWYRCYETSDGAYMAVGAIEHPFYVALLEGLGLDAKAWPRNANLDTHALTQAISDRFRSADRAHWVQVFGETDACVSPVLSLEEAQDSAAARERRAYIDVAGVRQPAPLPRLVGQPLQVPSPPPAEGRDTISILQGLGRSPQQIDALLAIGAVAAAGP